MRHRPDGSFKWIGHYMDQWAKFHVLFPLVRKSAAEVAVALSTKCLHFIHACVMPGCNIWMLKVIIR